MANWIFTRPQGEYDYPNAEAADSGQTLTTTSAVATWLVATAVLIAGAVSVPATPAVTTWMVPTATLVAGPVTLSATPAMATWTAPAATLIPGQATLTATPAIATWTVPDGTLLLITTLAADPAVATWVAPDATLVPGEVALVATAAVADWTVPDATINAPAPNAAITGGGRSYGPDYGTLNRGTGPRGVSHGWLNRDYRPPTVPVRTIASVATEAARVAVVGVDAPFDVGPIQVQVLATQIQAARVIVTGIEALMQVGSVQVSAGARARAIMPQEASYSDADIVLFLLAPRRM